MTDLKNKLEALDLSPDRTKEDVGNDIRMRIKEVGFTVVEEDTSRPWGAFFRLDNKNAERFVEDFFTDLSLEQARLGNRDAELSPKILLVSPGQRLSWQYHHHRAELWKFISTGGYHRSLTDEQGDLINSGPGDIVQFQTAERHRLVGAPNHYTLVAEIWQHTDAQQMSDEADIVRLQDDYKR
ncbi:phosphoheptose isomerase [Patescibacteria group bacterium]|nr:MAG: phosphoheptose isomerase [Patescibacteria group bacterium]